MDSSATRRELVIPGDVIETHGLKPGEGTYVDGGKVFASLLGIRSEHEGYVDVIPLTGRYIPRADVRDDVAALSRTLAAHGMEMLVLDQTRPDIGLPVVKVIVPGLRPFWARFAPGRLFDVPVRLGRLAAPTPYEQLNPLPMFL